MLNVCCVAHTPYPPPPPPPKKNKQKKTASPLFYQYRHTNPPKEIIPPIHCNYHTITYTHVIRYQKKVCDFLWVFLIADSFLLLFYDFGVEQVAPLACLLHSSSVIPPRPDQTP